MKNLFEQLRILTALPGVSGREQAIVRHLKSQLSPLVDEVEVDAFGNLMAFRDGGQPGPRYMISVHSDEVGAVVTSITDDGFLVFHTVGVVDDKIFPGMRLLVDGRIEGTVVCVPGHAHQRGQIESQGIRDHLIDIGAKSVTQVLDCGIEPGVAISFIGPLRQLTTEDLVMGKAIDNRIGCLILIRLFERLKNHQFPGAFYGVATVQEEIGMMGAAMIAHKINPDFAIVIDTVQLDDTPFGSMPDVPIQLGKGPVLQTWVGKSDLFLGTVANQAVSKLIKSASNHLDLPLQQTAAWGKWVTDGAAIHKSREGIPVSFLSIPRRYGHTPNEVANLNDASAAIDILEQIVLNETEHFCSNFLCD